MKCAHGHIVSYLCIPAAVTHISTVYTTINNNRNYFGLIGIYGDTTTHVVIVYEVLLLYEVVCYRYSSIIIVLHRITPISHCVCVYDALRGVMRHHLIIFSGHKSTALSVDLLAAAGWVSEEGTSVNTDGSVRGQTFACVLLLL